MSVATTVHGICIKLITDALCCPALVAAFSYVSLAKTVHLNVCDAGHQWQQPAMCLWLRRLMLTSIAVHAAHQYCVLRPNIRVLATHGSVSSYSRICYAVVACRCVSLATTLEIESIYVPQTHRRYALRPSHDGLVCVAGYYI